MNNLERKYKRMARQDERKRRRQRKITPHHWYLHGQNYVRAVIMSYRPKDCESCILADYSPTLRTVHCRITGRTAYTQPQKGTVMKDCPVETEESYRLPRTVERIRRWYTEKKDERHQ